MTKGNAIVVQLWTVVVILAFPSLLSAQNWSDEDIDVWIRKLEGAAQIASGEGDGICHDILTSAGAGYGNANVVAWNDQLLKKRGWNGVTIINRVWGRTKIEIDPNSDNVIRTIIHEGMHASGMYSISAVHSMQSTIQRCANAYFPH